MTRPEAELFPTVLQPGIAPGRWLASTTSCQTFFCPLMEQKEEMMELKVHQRMLFDREDDEFLGIVQTAAQRLPIKARGKIG